MAAELRPVQAVRAGRRDSICFGPFMLGGVLIAILVSGLSAFLD